MLRDALRDYWCLYLQRCTEILDECCVFSMNTAGNNIGGWKSTVSRIIFQISVSEMTIEHHRQAVTIVAAQVHLCTIVKRDEVVAMIHWFHFFYTVCIDNR